MSTQTKNYNSAYPVVTANPIALFILYQPATTVVYNRTVNSKVTPCQPTVQSFNNINSIKELPPCQPTLKELLKGEQPLYDGLEDF